MALVVKKAALWISTTRQMIDVQIVLLSARRARTISLQCFWPGAKYEWCWSEHRSLLLFDSDTLCSLNTFKSEQHLQSPSLGPLSWSDRLFIPENQCVLRCSRLIDRGTQKIKDGRRSLATRAALANDLLGGNNQFVQHPTWVGHRGSIVAYRQQHHQQLKQ